jgi:hypothetical protein
MANQIRLSPQNSKWAESVLIHVKNNPAHKNQSLAGLCNLAIEFGQKSVEAMFDYKPAKKTK